MFDAFALFLNRSPKNIVHLSTNSGDAMSWSTFKSRLDGFVSFTNASTSAAEGIRPVRSSVTRRRNSPSDVSGADRMPAVAMRLNIKSSMKFVRGTVVGSRVPELSAPAFAFDTSYRYAETRDVRSDVFAWRW